MSSVNNAPDKKIDAPQGVDTSDSAKKIADNERIIAGIQALLAKPEYSADTSNVDFMNFKIDKLKETNRILIEESLGDLDFTAKPPEVIRHDVRFNAVDISDPTTIRLDARGNV